MGIRLVYGLKTHDVSYLDSFFPSMRLSEAARRGGIDYLATIFDPGAPPAALEAFCRGHVALLRGELPMSLYEALESSGIAVVNGSTATALARDKLKSAEFFHSIGAAHPETRAIDFSATRPPLAFPFVRKPRYGKMGRGVALVDGNAAWSAFKASDEFMADEFIAQAYVASSRGMDVRFFFAGFAPSDETSPWAPRSYGATSRSPGAASRPRDYPSGPEEAAPLIRSVCALRRGPGFTSNAHTGGSMEPFAAPEAWGMEAERIFRRSGLGYGTVDFMFADELGSSFVVCETNSCPGFQELERASGLDVAGAILATVASKGTR